jgi:23S rRNA A1618 N6-methylase RlmF
VRIATNLIYVYTRIRMSIKKKRVFEEVGTPTNKLINKKKKRRNTDTFNGNSKMRRDNIYSNGYQFSLFSDTSLIYKYLNKSEKFTSIDWENYDAVKALNLSLLERDFDISINIDPPGRLIPSIPNRLNYILWIKDLISNTKNIGAMLSSNNNDAHDYDKIVGIDIGTGASCIYPLLGTSINKSWQFYATEIDDDSFNNATKNVSDNKMSNKIKVIKGSKNTFFRPIFDDTAKHNDKSPNIDPKNKFFMFSMCNPPYFSSADEWNCNKKSAFGGHPIEMVTDGGEERFISHMINESIHYRHRIVWFTTLIGIKKHVEVIVKKLKSLSLTTPVCDIRRHTFKQGRTSRWGVAWSFFSNIVKDELLEIKFNITTSIHNNYTSIISSEIYLKQCIAEFLKYQYDDNENKYIIVEKNSHNDSNSISILKVSFNHIKIFDIKLNIDGEYDVILTCIPKSSSGGSSNNHQNNSKFHFFKIADKLKGCILKSRKWKRRQMTMAMKKKM